MRLRRPYTDDEGNEAVATGQVTALDPPRLVESATEPHGVLRFELREDDDGTALTFIVTTPAPNEQIALARSGWHIDLEHLADALDGRPVDCRAGACSTVALGRDPRGRRRSERRSASAAGRARYGEWLPGSSTASTPRRSTPPPRPRRVDHAARPRRESRRDVGNAVSEHGAEYGVRPGAAGGGTRGSWGASQSG